MRPYHRLADIQHDLSTGLLTPSDLVDHYLAQIEAQQHLNLFIEVYAEEARTAAQALTQKLTSGTAGRLAGLVIGVKDVICHEGHGLTASSHMLDGFTSQFTATALSRLLAEDAIVIGRQSCDEFAMGSSNETAYYGPARNPLDPKRVPGGSSGASAAAVRAGMCHASLGSDTGGSVRQPAAFCGVVGLKPSYGRISRWGLIAYASSFDQIGPITHSIEDAALLLECMAGADSRDQTAHEVPVPAYTQALQAADEHPLRIGIIPELLDSPGLDAATAVAMRELIDQLEAAGHEIKRFSFPLAKYLVPCYYILTTAESSSNLLRYDGVRYGYRSPEANDLESLYVQSRTEGFGEEVKRRIMLGTFVLSAGYVDAYYTQAMRVRRLIAEQTREMLTQCDVLLTPTTPEPAFKLGEKQEDPISMYLADIFTVHANLAGVPSISLPWFAHPSGLPIGVQLMGSMLGEAQMLQAARRINAYLQQ